MFPFKGMTFTYLREMCYKCSLCKSRTGLLLDKVIDCQSYMFFRSCVVRFHQPNGLCVEKNCCRIFGFFYSTLLTHILAAPSFIQEIPVLHVLMVSLVSQSSWSQHSSTLKTADPSVLVAVRGCRVAQCGHDLGVILHH